LPRHPKKGYFKTTVTQLKLSRHYYIIPTSPTWHNSHRFHLHISGSMPPVHKLCKRPSYYVGPPDDGNTLKPKHVVDMVKPVRAVSVADGYFNFNKVI
jgi:hypothetical protein